ncbi:hypothetical protein M9X92_010948 [Pyricularia oryzae]|nr:hypothetical protein M9X92_010948 [Pyricularia oryzae]
MVLPQDTTGCTDRKTYAPERKRHAAVVGASDLDLDKIKRSRDATPDICCQRIMLSSYKTEDASSTLLSVSGLFTQSSVATAGQPTRKGSCRISAFGVAGLTPILKKSPAKRYMAKETRPRQNKS